MAEPDDRFLSRWARLKEQEKAQSVEDAPKHAPKDVQPVAATEITGTAPEDDEAGREKLIAALPDIDTLEESSDFTVFLQSGVPEALRRRALRKLWRLNPVFANLDGLNDYDEDFTDAATVIEGLKTLYQVGKGMVTPEDEAAEAEHDGDHVDRKQHGERNQEVDEVRFVARGGRAVVFPFLDHERERAGSIERAS